MKNKLLILLFAIFICLPAFAESILIESKNITVDKSKKTSIFENEVTVKTENGDIIKSNFAEYNKSTGLIILKKNISATDSQNNIIETENAEYSEKDKTLKTFGSTVITTSEKYVITGQDIILNNKKNFIRSNKKTLIKDMDGNEISLDNFEYQKDQNIFKSISKIKIIDKTGNKYEFSQIYIDTKKKEILGTDTKAFLNDASFKPNIKNKPRVFSNSIRINKDKSLFNKSIFTLCDYRENDKCPPWTIQASKMLHNNKNKTIYYDNAVIKVYDIPIFYIPKLSHPDPTVDRRTGFLTPSFLDTKNLGSGLTIPYFWALSADKNFTLKNKLFVNENPLFLGEYHQAFKNSNFLADFGYTEGYKKQTSSKKSGEKSHFFSKFVKNFDAKNGAKQTLNLSIQDVSNDKYLKLYRVESNLVDYNTSTLENSLNFFREDEDIFFGFSTSMYETLKENYNDKYEYIIPEITLDKNLFSDERLGNLDLQTNYKARKYDTNKFTNFFVNDLDWDFKEINHKNGLKSKVLGHVRNINYETKNVDLYKNDSTAEIYGAFGYFAELGLEKIKSNAVHSLKPKMLIRYSPGGMRKENSGSKLDPISAFRMDRLDNLNNFETGLSGTVGFDYNIKKNEKDFDFSVAQIINEKENKKMHSKTSLDEKLSDLVGATTYELSENIDLKYNFSIDQNYSDFNYNEVSTALNFDPIKFDFSYLMENKHIGDQEYFKTKIDLEKSNNGLFSFETKRNLVSSSAEFYNLSYEYLNDCLRAGIVYRREFYNDSELEPENSLMFKITLSPFGKVNSPSFSQ